MASTRHQYDKSVSKWHLTFFVVRGNFSVFGPPLKAHLLFISFDNYQTCYFQQDDQSRVCHNDQWSNHRIMIAQIWSKITNQTTCQIGIFEPLSKVISNYFLLILLPIIISHKTNKRVKSYQDQIIIWGIMAVQIGLKMSIFPIFQTNAL